MNSDIVNIEINKIYCGDSAGIMKYMPENFIDLTITSPPYDHLRHYDKNIKLNSKADVIYEFNFENIAKELYRVTKDGGVLVWIVNDATINGSETGNSFRQALFFMDLGFKLNDTMIYLKNGASFPAGRYKRYSQVFEYMFVFSKGIPKTANLIKDKPNKWAGTHTFGTPTNRQKDGSLRKEKNRRDVGEFGYRDNVWKIDNSNSDSFSKKHPAVFPEQLANDHIITWSNEGDLIYDPFCGSGTTLKMAKINKRNYIGSDSVNEYCELSQQRVNNVSL